MESNAPYTKLLVSESKGDAPNKHKKMSFDVEADSESSRRRLSQKLLARRPGSNNDRIGLVTAPKTNNKPLMVFAAIVLSWLPNLFISMEAGIVRSLVGSILPSLLIFSCVMKVKSLQRGRSLFDTWREYLGCRKVEYFYPALLIFGYTWISLVFTVSLYFIELDKPFIPYWCNNRDYTTSTGAVMVAAGNGIGGLAFLLGILGHAYIFKVDVDKLYEGRSLEDTVEQVCFSNSPDYKENEQEQEEKIGKQLAVELAVACDKKIKDVYHTHLYHIKTVPYAFLGAFLISVMVILQPYWLNPWLIDSTVRNGGSVGIVCYWIGVPIYIVCYFFLIHLLFECFQMYNCNLYNAKFLTGLLGSYNVAKCPSWISRWWKVRQFIVRETMYMQCKVASRGFGISMFCVFIGIPFMLYKFIPEDTNWIKSAITWTGYFNLFVIVIITSIAAFCTASLGVQSFAELQLSIKYLLVCKQKMLDAYLQKSSSLNGQKLADAEAKINAQIKYIETCISCVHFDIAPTVAVGPVEIDLKPTALNVLTSGLATAFIAAAGKALQAVMDKK